MEGPAYDLADGGRAWYDPATGIAVIAKNAYSATAYEMTFAKFLQLLQQDP